MEHAVDQLVQQWADAEMLGDADALAQLLTDDFIGIGPRGFMLTKAQWLARYRSGDLRTPSLVLDEATTRVYRDSAVVVARQVQQASFQGHDASGKFRVTLMAVLQAGSWQIAGWQASGPIPDGPLTRG